MNRKIKITEVGFVLGRLQKENTDLGVLYDNVVWGMSRDVPDSVVSPWPSVPTAQLTGQQRSG